jgi:hypothetical protein
VAVVPAGDLHLGILDTFFKLTAGRQADDFISIALDCPIQRHKERSYERQRRITLIEEKHIQQYLHLKFKLIY